jgi:hypothetical protein
MSLYDVVTATIGRYEALTTTTKLPRRAIVPPPPPPPRSTPHRDRNRLDRQHAATAQARAEWLSTAQARAEWLSTAQARAELFSTGPNTRIVEWNVIGSSRDSNAFTRNSGCGEEGIKKPPIIVQDWLICSWFGSEKLDDTGKVMEEHSQHSWDTMAMARAQDIKYFKTYNHQRRYWREGVKPINCKAKSDNSITHGLSGNALIYDERSTSYWTNGVSGAGAAAAQCSVRQDT